MRYPVIEKERLKNNITVAELSEELGICRKTYYNWQNNGKIPSFAVKKLTEIFGKSSDYLLNRVIKPSPDSGFQSYDLM